MELQHCNLGTADEVAEHVVCILAYVVLSHARGSVRLVGCLAG